jgi:ABC-2 type transport system permease protein
VKRSSFILSKLLANTIGLLITVVMLPGLVGYVQLSLFDGRPLPVRLFVAELGFASLYLLFYLSLTTMLGVLFNSRGPVLGVAVGVAFSNMVGLAGMLETLAPWIVWIAPESLLRLLQLLASGETMPQYWPAPIGAVLLYCALFTGVAFSRFNRHEF